MPSIRAQIVLFHNSLGEVWRLMRGLSAAVRAAKQAGSLRWLEVAIGDCSAAPCLTPPDVDDLLANLVEFDGLTYEYFDANLKSARGQNTLASNATTDMLLIINPDTYPSPTMLIHLLNALVDPLVGVAEARQVPLEHPKSFDLRTGDTSWASTCCVLVRRQAAFLRVDGFDAEFFPLYCDDVDFSWRVRLAGLRVIHVPRAIVFHDKTIEPTGRPSTSSIEVYESTLARFMLATKYGRPDILAQTIDYIETSGSEAQVLALNDFRRRQLNHDLPAELAGADRIAQFVNGEYAEHRF